LEGHSFHSFGFVNRTITWPPGKEKLFHGAIVIKVAGGANAIGERIGWTAIGVNAGAEDDCDVGRAAVVGLAEEKHLGEWKDGGTGGADGEGGEQPAAASLRHSRSPSEEDRNKRATHK